MQHLGYGDVGGVYALEAHEARAGTQFGTCTLICLLLFII